MLLRSYSPYILGLYGGSTTLLSILFQSTPPKNGWSFISSLPL